MTAFLSSIHVSFFTFFFPKKTHILSFLRTAGVSVCPHTHTEYLENYLLES